MVAAALAVSQPVAVVSTRRDLIEFMRQICRDVGADRYMLVDLTVRDSGSGIPPEALPKIFDRYYTTKAGPDASGKGGTGVGLSMCRDIIEAHQGKIRVESTVGMGTASFPQIFLCTLASLSLSPQSRRAAPDTAGTVPTTAGTATVDVLLMALERERR